MSGLGGFLRTRLFRRHTADHPLALCVCGHLKIDHTDSRESCKVRDLVGVDYDYTGHPQRWDPRPCFCEVYVASGPWDRGGLARLHERPRSLD
jgi:hypothetical protein